MLAVARTLGSWTPAAAAPSAPGLTLTPGDKQITVAVTAPNNQGGGVKGYQLHVSTIAQPGGLVNRREVNGCVALNVVNQVLGGLSHGTRYDVAVRANDTAGCVDKGWGPTSHGSAFPFGPPLAAPVENYNHRMQVGKPPFESWFHRNLNEGGFHYFFTGLTDAQWNGQQGHLKVAINNNAGKTIRAVTLGGGAVLGTAIIHDLPPDPGYQLTILPFNRGGFGPPLVSTKIPLP